MRYRKKLGLDNGWPHTLPHTRHHVKKCRAAFFPETLFKHDTALKAWAAPDESSKKFI